MAKFNIERAYIESYDEKNDSHKILVHIKDENDHILAGSIETSQNASWIYMQTAGNGDLEIIYSAGMEDNKWDYITEEILGDAIR